MMKRLRILCLILCMTLLCGSLPTALAEMSTLGVYFCGLLERVDGTMEPVRLNGRFYVIQNGETLGVIQAGEESVILSGRAPVTVKPVMSTMPSGWSIPEEGTSCVPGPGGTTMVPFMVHPSADANVTPVPVEGYVTPEPEMTPVPEVQPTTEPEGDGEISVNDLIEDNTPVVTPIPTFVPEQKNTAPMTTVFVDRSMVETPTPEPSATPVPETPAPVENGGTLLVHVFNDVNNNGEEAKNESVVSGVKVEAVNADGQTVAYTLTDEYGDARMEGLVPGKYKIRVEAPQGWGYSKVGKSTEVNSNFMEPSVETVQESASVQVNADSVVARGVGIWQLIHVSGFCWLETEADGIRKPGEEMLAGVRVVMKGQKNGLTYETTSDNDGNWYIGQVKPGFYDLTVYVPDGMVFTKYSRIGGDNRSIFTYEGKTQATKVLDTNDGAPAEQQNVGFVKASNITGMCFLDANYNGIYDEGEKPLPGVKVQAYKANGEMAGEAFSGEDGIYTMRALRGNTYSIRCVLPEKPDIAFTKVVATEDGNRFRVRQGFRETTIDGQILAPGELKRINAGAIFYGSISGYAYIDKDFSGTMESKESVVSGLSVSLTDENGKILDTVKTNGKGKFTFEKLTPGTYQIQLTAKEGYAFTRSGEGNVILNTSGGNGKSEPIELELGANLTNQNAGMIVPGTVSGTVFADANDNGLKDGGEQGAEGMVVMMLSDGDPAYATTVNRDGSFKFDAVMPGSYQLCYVLPERGIFAKIVKGGNTLEGETSAQTDTFNIGSAGSYTAPLVGVLQLGRIDGTMFRDSNGNGIMDPDEETVSGVTVDLVPGREDLEAMTLVTGDDGAFVLDALHPDTYSLRITFPEGSVMSRNDDVKLPVRSGTSGEDQALVFNMGSMITEQALGCVIPASLQGRIWLDENNNGLFEADEKTPAGQKISVIDEKTGKLFAELLTDENGCFGTSGMIPGSFTVSYEMDRDCTAPKEGDSTFSLLGGKLVMNGIRLTENENRNDLLLGIVRYTSMGGKVWLDEQGEIVPLMNATITLKYADGTKIQDKVTAENGEYVFSGLMPDDYLLEVILPDGCLVVKPDDERLQGELNSVMTTVNGREGNAGVIHLFMGEDRMDLNIGSVVPGQLGDFCWLDENGNGWQDGDEKGIPGVRIRLTRDGETLMETVSDEYGFYRFTDVYPATYILKVVAPDEVKPTVKTNGIPVLVSALKESEDSASETDGIQVTSNKANYNVDMGFVLKNKGVYPAGYGDGTTQRWQ